MENTMEQLDHKIVEAQEVMRKDLWALYTKIGEAKTHRTEAWREMVELGQLAHQLLTLESIRPE